MSVHYKFKTALDYTTLFFNGESISVLDLKREIIREKQLTQCDIQITNADTKQVYNNETSFIPTETSVIIARIPMTTNSSYSSSFCSSSSNNNTDLAEKNVSVQQRKGALAFVSPSITLCNNYDSASSSGGGGTTNVATNSAAYSSANVTNPNPNPVIKNTRPVPFNYCCNKCRVPGHWIEDCPLRNRQVNQASLYSPSSSSSDLPHVIVPGKSVPPPGYRCRKCFIQGHWHQDCPVPFIDQRKRSSGIPRSLMIPVVSNVPGALVTVDGHYAVPAINQEAQKEKHFRHEHHPPASHHYTSDLHGLNPSKKPRMQ